MYFDGAKSREGASAGIWMITPNKEFLTSSYKLNFECTNNVAEYEALILGLNVFRDFKVKKIEVFGDSELVVNQVKSIYQTKHPRMRTYRNEVWDLLENFFDEHKIATIPRDDNTIANSLAIAGSNFRIPNVSKNKYDIEVMHRPSVPDNVKHWQVFEDDQQIKRFLEMTNKFNHKAIDAEAAEACLEEEDSPEKTKQFKNKIGGKDIIQLKNNVIPKGLIPLEQLFDKNDVAKNTKVEPRPADERL